tara:strand:+ start:1149 stop:1385 length:237 start_codon:yes stop_codon:yes gene_type:complete
MGKVKTDWKEQLKKLNNKEQKQKEREQAVVSLKNKTAKKNKEKAVKLKFLNENRIIERFNSIEKDFANLIVKLDKALS